MATPSGLGEDAAAGTSQSAEASSTAAAAPAKQWNPNDNQKVLPLPRLEPVATPSGTGANTAAGTTQSAAANAGATGTAQENGDADSNDGSWSHSSWDWSNSGWTDSSWYSSSVASDASTWRTPTWLTSPMPAPPVPCEQTQLVAPQDYISLYEVEGAGKIHQVLHDKLTLAVKTLSNDIVFLGSSAGKTNMLCFFIFRISQNSSSY